MRRRKFLERINYGLIGATLGVAPTRVGAKRLSSSQDLAREEFAEIAIIGGGLGGCAAALAACRNGHTVILTEETDWLGGQVSQQGVPPDEHRWIETHGAPKSYRSYRNQVRDYYRAHYPLTLAAYTKLNLNPGDGAVSRLCHEPRVSVAVLQNMLAPYVSSGQLQIKLQHRIVDAEVRGDEVMALEVKNLVDEHRLIIEANYFIDATELGDVLPLTGTEYVTGSEAKSETNELHAGEIADPKNHQAFTLCFALDYIPGENHIIDRPGDYDRWSTYRPTMDPPWAGKLIDLDYSNPKTLEPKMLGFHPEGLPTGNRLNLWNYRRIINRNNFRAGFYPGDITAINWPQNDFFSGNLIDVSETVFRQHLADAEQLNLSLLYWLQTEAPRPDGGQGWPGIRLRKDVMGTENGMAKYPYVRESRRIKAQFTVLEEHVGAEQRLLLAGPSAGKKSAHFFDSVGIGYYHIDLHPSTGGNNYIDFASLPFQIPLGALLPVRMQNLIPANKNIGTTHITNGCYRLHPVEWSIGEAAGLLVSRALQKKVPPVAIRDDEKALTDFQRWISKQGIETEWYTGR